MSDECNHINLIKQVGPLDGGPAKSTRYRCQNPECGAFLVTKPYVVEVSIGPRNPSSEAGLPSMEEIGMGDLAWGLAKRAIVEKWSDAELGPAIAKFARLWHAEQEAALAKEARDAGPLCSRCGKPQTPSWTCEPCIDQISREVDAEAKAEVVSEAAARDAAKETGDGR